MIKLKKFWPFLLILFISLLFFFPVFKGKIPFPGDLLVSQNPYSSESYLGYAPGSYPNKAQGPDVITEIYPWRYFSMQSLKSGDIPFWNPHNFSGNPQLANFQSAVFYPLNFLYFALPFNVSWTLIILSQPILAGLFMYLFLFKGIGIKKFPSVLGAVAFAFSSYMSVWMEYGNIGATFLWLPLVLLFTGSFVKNGNFKSFLGLCFSLTLSILAGYIQGVFYIYILCFFYYVFLLFKNKEKFSGYKKHILFILSLSIPFLLTAFQILPTLAVFGQSTRGAYSLDQITKNLSPLVNLITVVIPDYFGNPATRNYWVDGTYIERVMYPTTLLLFFAIFAVSAKINIAEKKFFTIVSVLSLLIATNLPFIKYLYLIPIPVISTTVATRELSIFIFSVIVLGAIGLDNFLETKEISKKFLLIYLFFYVLIWAVTIALYKLNPVLSTNLTTSIRNLILPTVLIFLTSFFIIFAKRININIVKGAVLIIVVVDLFYFFYKITPFTPQELIYPKTPVISYIEKTAGINRFWGYGLGYIAPNYQSVDGTYSPEGNDPLHISRYGQLLASSQNGKIPVVVPRPDANIAPGFATNDLNDNFFRKRILDLVGAKYLLQRINSIDAWQTTDTNTFPKKDYTLVYKTFPWQIFVNKNAIPRVYITGNYILAKDKNQSLSFIYNPNVNLKNTIVLENSPTMTIDHASKGVARVTSYKSNKVIIKVNSNGNSLLFLSDSFYPDWSVRIDGKTSKILIADFAFRAVEIPKGDHVVEFFYNANDFKTGLVLSIFGIVILLGLFYYAKINKKTF